MIINILGIVVSIVLMYKWRYRIMSLGLYIPFVRRYVVAHEFKKMQTMID